MKTSRVEAEIMENPGITFSELKENLDLANGQLQYHLKKSEAERKGKGYVIPGKCRECQLRDKCQKECLKKALKNQRYGRIMSMLDRRVKKKDIAEELSISCSTLSYHLRKMREAGLIEGNRLRVSPDS